MRATTANLVFLGVGEVATRGLSFVAFAYIGRTLSPSEFGHLGAALAVMMVCTLLVDQGFGILGSREIAKDHAVTPGLVRAAVSAQLALAAGVCALVLVGTWLFPLPATFAGLLRGLALSLLGVPFLLGWVFQGRNEMFWYAAPTVLRWSVFLVAALLLVHAPEDVALLPIAEIAAVAAAGALWVSVYRRTGGRLARAGPGEIAALFRDGLPIGISNLIWALRMYVPVLVVYSQLSSQAAGYFESAHRIVMVFVALLGVYFTNLFPMMSASSRGSAPAFVAILRRAVLTSTAATLALCVGTFFLAPTFLVLVFGADYVNPESVEALTVLTLLAPVLAWRRAGRNALIVLDRQRPELVCSLAGVALLAILLVPLTRSHGITGAAWAMVISEFAGTALTWVALRPGIAELRAA